MHIIVTGGRHYDDRNYVFGALDALHAVTPIARLAHGGATGADKLAGEWAQSRKVPEVEYPVTPEQWRKIGRKAGPMRNANMYQSEKDIAENGDDLYQFFIDELRVVAFPGNAGTAGMCKIARKGKTKVIEMKGSL